jgi:hypothetical protein
MRLILTLLLLAFTGCISMMDDPSCDKACELRADYFDCKYEGGTWNGIYCHGDRE